ncbi:TorCAD operon transcriptional regulatory protein TorR [compost metagenome]
MSPSPFSSNYQRSAFDENTSQIACLTSTLPIALVDSNSERRETFRHYLDILNHPSLAFESIERLLLIQRAGHRFGLLVIALQDEFNYLAIKKALDANANTRLLLIQPHSLQEQRRLIHIFSGQEKMESMPYLTSEQEFVSKIQWLMQATSFTSSYSRELNSYFSYGAYKFDRKSRIIWNGDTPIELRPQEFDMALAFFQNIGEVLSRERLHLIIRPSIQYNKSQRVIDVCISRIRRGLKLFGENGLSLSPVYRRGYILNSWLDSSNPAQSTAII